MRPEPATTEEMMEEVQLSRSKLIIEDPVLPRKPLSSPSRRQIANQQQFGNAPSSSTGAIWIPTGVTSSLTSHHRQELADAKLALRALKQKKNDEKYISGVFNGQLY